MSRRNAERVAERGQPIAWDSLVEEQRAAGRETLPVARPGDRGIRVRTVVDQRQWACRQPAVSIEQGRQLILLLGGGEKKWRDRGQQLGGHFRVENEVAQAAVGCHPAPGEQRTVGNQSGRGIGVEGLGIRDVEPVAPNAASILHPFNLGQHRGAGVFVTRDPPVRGGQEPGEIALLDNGPAQAGVFRRRDLRPLSRVPDRRGSPSRRPGGLRGRVAAPSPSSRCGGRGSAETAEAVASAPSTARRAASPSRPEAAAKPAWPSLKVLTATPVSSTLITRKGRSGRDLDFPRQRSLGENLPPFGQSGSPVGFGRRRRPNSGDRGARLARITEPRGGGPGGWALRSLWREDSHP